MKEKLVTKKRQLKTITHLSNSSISLTIRHSLQIFPLPTHMNCRTARHNPHLTESPCEAMEHKGTQTSRQIQAYRHTHLIALVAAHVDEIPHEERTPQIFPVFVRPSISPEHRPSITKDEEEAEKEANKYD